MHLPPSRVVPALLFVLAACGDPPSAAKVPQNGAAGSPASSSALTSSAHPNSPTATGVRIAPEVAQLCGITAPQAYFGFDSANLTQFDTRVLDQVAACIAAGKLKGRPLRLVGHTDSRGTDEYNMTLGQSRADSVIGYLAKRGAPRGAMQSTTRGELDAKGMDESGWTQDRRVDVTLGN